MLLEGKHPFPKDIEDMIRRLQHKPGAITTEIAMDAFDWERGERLDIDGNVLRELEEETGLAESDVSVTPGCRCATTTAEASVPSGLNDSVSVAVTVYVAEVSGVPLAGAVEVRVGAGATGGRDSRGGGVSGTVSARELAISASAAFCKTRRPRAAARARGRPNAEATRS